MSVSDWLRKCFSDIHQQQWFSIIVRNWLFESNFTSNKRVPLTFLYVHLSVVMYKKQIKTISLTFSHRCEVSLSGFSFSLLWPAGHVMLNVTETVVTCWERNENCEADKDMKKSNLSSLKPFLGRENETACWCSTVPSYDEAFITQQAPTLTCWGSWRRTGARGTHNGSRAPCRARRCTAAGWTHGSCQMCQADRWSWGARTPQSEGCNSAAYSSSLTASSVRGNNTRWDHH